VREGRLPEDAAYAASIYVPAVPEEAVNWNIMHFRGGDGDSLDPSWDLSIGITADGALELFVFDHATRSTHLSDPPVPLPTGRYVDLEFRMRRAADATGIVTVRQSGQQIIEVRDVVTGDTRFGQWYVGNLADRLSAPASTLYVDDVSINPAP
jgi:hypothetical protein